MILKKSERASLIAVPSVIEWKGLLPRVPLNNSFLRPKSLAPELDAACLGVGMAQFAGNLSRLIFSKNYSQVFLLGVCGAYPGSLLSLEDIVRVDTEFVGDEGYLGSGNSFIPFNAKPFPYSASPYCRAPRVIQNFPGVKGISVNMLSTDPEFLRFRARFSGAKVESMEGAVAFSICRASKISIYEIRAVSNIVGERDKSKWKLQEALFALRKKVLDPLIGSYR
ncbi:MAG: hypothetical protein WCR04_07410 [Fibrobacteraceae bacterium]